ncbi:MAG: hypothetical protein AB7J34_13140 [Limisphaerales bacterium]
MIATVAKKVVVNDQGTPVEVILSWKTFQEIAEAMGWDLDATAKGDLRRTRRDLAMANHEAFFPLSALFPQARASGDATLNANPEPQS